MKIQKESDIEKRKLLLALVFPLLFIVLFWLIKIVEISLGISLAQYGMRPRDFSQWFGIITMPFLHSGFSHLIANSSSFLILGTLLFYFYSKYSFQVIGWAWLMTGVLTWIIGRDGSVHIGASGLIYAFAGFIFFSGLLSKNIRLMAISLIVVFLYGSMVWGLFPQETNISWEGHLSGFVAGIILAFAFNPKKLTDEIDEGEDENYESNKKISSTADDNSYIVYSISKNEK